VVHVGFASGGTIYRVNQFAFACTFVATQQEGGCSYIYRASHGKSQALHIVPNLPNQNSVDPRSRVRDKGFPTRTCSNRHALIGKMEGGGGRFPAAAASGMLLQTLHCSTLVNLWAEITVDYWESS
jgi:hypothetical protein